ncbi:ATP/GTP-binding protein [Actinophytocola sp.]|uniref:AAA family ATPase n=1 Tax=Actinophytocola sp. TaxID=1872138 RepID=UPI0025B898E1|nr:ATP-binding protein [Actinophytocola sp.]
MLRSFRLANHRSIADEQELLLMPANHAERSVVPVTAIYGANASGKSNVIDGLGFMQSAVLQSFARWDVEGGVPRRPFRLSAQGRDQPSVYVAELVVDDVPYTYGFAVDDTEVVEEWLYSYPEKRRRMLFRRKRGDITFGTTLGGLKPKLEMLEELTRPNALFLSAANRLNLGALSPVYEWFRGDLRIRGSSHAPDTGLAERIQRLISTKPDNLNRLVSLLAAADVGITDVRIKETINRRHVHNIAIIEERIADLTGLLDSDTGPRGKRGITAELHNLHRELEYFERRGAERRAELRFVHGVEDELFSLGEESDGTRSWLRLLPTVLNVLDEGAVLAVDEIDTSLHPLLTAQLVRLFQDPETNPDNAQLIFTTHDTSLLGTMIGDVLTRDQIWFVQKNAAGATEIYPLTDFKPRKGQNIERRYLGGSYGAVPVLDEEDFVNAVRNR